MHNNFFNYPKILLINNFKSNTYNNLLSKSSYTNEKNYKIPIKLKILSASPSSYIIIYINKHLPIKLLNLFTHHSDINLYNEV